MVNVKMDMTGWVMAKHGVPDSRLTVIRQVEDYVNPNTGAKHARWECECSCEKHNRIIAVGAQIKNGSIKSCGCHKAEISRINGMVNKKYNDFHTEIDEDGKTYFVGKSSNSDDVFYVSSEDYDIIKGYCWRVNVDKRNGYKRLITSIHLPNRKCKIKTIWSIITGYDYVDHKDGNTMNNRRENLRESNHLLNMQNRKTHKNNKSNEPGIGVINKKYTASIRFDNKEYNLGTYKDFETALLVRIRAEAAVFDKEYAPHRDLFEQYNIDVEYEKVYWNEWISKTGINYLREPTHPWQRKVVQLTLDGEYINTFDSMMIASKHTGVSYSGIQGCCRGGYGHKSAGGFRWMYKDDYDKLTQQNDLNKIEPIENLEEDEI